jgi:subtilase family serine protease
VPGNSPAVSEMAADPHVTAMSGTSFTPNFNANGNDVGHVPERVWNDPEDGIGGGDATGGGVSSIFAKPAFQSGPGVPADGKRDVPDLSLIASPNFPGSFFVASRSCANPVTGCTGKGGTISGMIGGTSLSAPAFAGIANLIAQAAGARLFNMDPTIYALANHDLAGSGFRDVVTGNNSFNGVGGFTAGPDYDLCTGWGTVDAATFVAAYAGTLPGPASVTLTPASLSFATVRVGRTSTPKSVTIGVPKGQPVWTRITSVTGSGVFSAAQTCVGKWIGPGKTCKFGVTFKPTSAGSVGPLTLTVIDNALNSPQTATMSGTGK